VFFFNNAALIQQMLEEARSCLQQSRFFGGQPALLEGINQHALNNTNSAWAMIVLGQWMRSFPVGL